MNDESVKLLLRDLRNSLLNDDCRAALRRISLFEFMYFGGY